MEIKSKVVIVTGAASGIGKALASRFCDEGALCVAMCDVHGSGIGSASGPIGGMPFVCDVTDPAQVSGVVKTVEKQFGHVDLYCANAGILERGGVDVADSVWRRSMEVNMMSHVYAARACLPGMIANGGGYFLNTVSAAGLLSQIGAVTYSVSKHAAIGFAEWLAFSHGHQGIRVTVLCPQAVNTAMLEDRPDGGVAGLDGVLSPERTADCALEAIREERFLALPHARVLSYFQNKATDYDRWLKGMQRLREKFPEG
jgi:NAD(P)-dependent dehydrogenase (short-subunit alcohol dehydrogenase family)